MVSKKSIVLSGVEDSSQRAVLTIECDGQNASGRVRLYNFGNEPEGILTLGIYSQGNVVKAGLTNSSGMLYTFGCQMQSIPQDFSCAIINFLQGKPSPILYGVSDGKASKEDVFANIFGDLASAKSMSQVEDVLDEYGVDYEVDIKQEIENEIEECVKVQNCKECENCVYKKYYFASVDQEQEESYKEKSNKFYNEIKGQIDKLFANNPSEEYLQRLLPNSKWVKVNVEDKGDYYVLGLIYEKGQLKYICYGVPGVYQKNAPRQLSGFPVWLPLDESHPEGFGYWLTYQDADSGESIKATII